MACEQTSSAASRPTINVMFLCDEWKSSKGGLSTFNREFAVNLAKTAGDRIKVHCYVSQSDEVSREDARQHGVELITARSIPGSVDLLDRLKIPPPELPNPDIVVGHGRKFGTPAYFIVQTAKCKWMHFVHVFCEDLGKFKATQSPTVDPIEENEKKHKSEIELCKAADRVITVGSRLQRKYSKCLRHVKVEIITPGIFEKFLNESSQLVKHNSVHNNFSVFMFGRASFEDLSLKGYDIVANAIVSLGKTFDLTFVGSSSGEHKKIEQWFIDHSSIRRNQITIRSYCSEQDELMMMFQESDMVAIPSRTEGFGLVALEAISAGIPVLVAGESGIAEALLKVEGGKSVIVESDDTEEWAQRIQQLSRQSQQERENNAKLLRENYKRTYPWNNECQRFIGMIEVLVESPNVSKNVGSRRHPISGTRVDGSCHPSTWETQSQETSADQGEDSPANVANPALLSAVAKFRRLASVKKPDETTPSSPTQKGFRRVRVLFDFQARNSKELTVQKGDEVAVLLGSRQFWCVRNSKGSIGFVPKTIVEETVVLPNPPTVAPPPTTKVTSSQTLTRVIIRGLSQDTTEDALLNYFENARRSGGGQVEEVNIKGDWARIKFESAEVAKCVVEREKHTLNEATLDVSFEMCGRRDENIKTIEVAGLPGSTTEDMIWDYFENTRRSGGREVETVDLRHEAGVAFVTFKDIGVVNTVLQKDKHVLDGAILKVTASNNMRCLPDREEAEESRVIEVRGLPATATKDYICYFFENTRHSGGGDIEDVDHMPEQGIAIVTFVKAESAVGVVNKGALTLHDADLKVTIRKPVKKLPIDTKRLLVKGLSDETTRDGLQCYMELVSGVEVLSIGFGQQGSAAVTFDEIYDYQTITQKVAKRQLDGRRLSIEQVPVCNCVQVTCLNKENTTKGAVLCHFQNPKNGGGDVINVELNRKEGWALVHFEDPEVATKVFSKSHTLNGAKLEVSLHSPFLGKPLSQPEAREVELVASIPVDSQVMLFNTVRLPTGCRRFLAKYREQELRQIEEDLKEYSTRIKQVADEDDEDLIISGTTDGVEKGTKLVQDLASKVRSKKLFLDKPGMRKILGQSKGKKLLSLLENENKCVIEHYISEKYESSKRAGEEKEENQRKKEVYQAGMPPSAAAGSEKMKRGRWCGVTIKSSDPDDSYLEIFAGTKQHIDKIIKGIEKDVADHCKQKVIVHDAIGKLSKQQTRKIRDLQAEHDVLVTIEEPIARISIRGAVEDVLDAVDTIHEILNQQREEDYLRRVEELVAKNIQWFFRDDDGSWEPYDTCINLQIENAFYDGQDSVIVEIDDARCEIVFKDMKETCFEDGEERLVVRKELGKGIPLPKEWDVQPKEEEVLLAPLDPVTHANEYKKIADEVHKTSPVTITKIQRVQNPTLYRVYMVRKDQMELKKGSNEQRLFLGTHTGSCASINKIGFNRSYCGKNDTIYGNGVYFSRDASYSAQIKHSPPDGAGNRHMYLARVLVGEYTTGLRGMITPPPKGSAYRDAYDTVVDNPRNPTIFVVFYDNQCYPDYLITFK